MNSYKILITSTNSNKIAHKIQTSILEEKLSPCINIIDGVKSSYLWKDKIVMDEEIILIIKSRSEDTQKIRQIIFNVHNYDTPELISINFDILSDKYASWFNKCLVDIK